LPFPTITLSVSLACLIIFLGQEYSTKSLDTLVNDYCKSYYNIAPSKKHSAKIIEQAKKRCIRSLKFIHLSKNKHQAIVQTAVYYTKKNRSNLKYELRRTQRLYTPFLAPDFNLTSYLKYRSNSWNPWHMLTSVFAHKDWSHLLFNLFHFLLFGCLVEMLLGKKAYVLSFLLMTYGSQLVYSTVFAMIDTPSETIGLSGVVWGMIGLGVVLINAVGIRYIPNKVFNLVWVFVIAFIGISVYQSFPEEMDSGINVVVHAAGAIIGLLIGIFSYKRVRENFPNEKIQQQGSSQET